MPATRRRTQADRCLRHRRYRSNILRCECHRIMCRVAHSAVPLPYGTSVHRLSRHACAPRRIYASSITGHRSTARRSLCWTDRPWGPAVAAYARLSLCLPPRLLSPRPLSPRPLSALLPLSRPLPEFAPPAGREMSGESSRSSCSSPPSEGSSTVARPRGARREEAQGPRIKKVLLRGGEDTRKLRGEGGGGRARRALHVARRSPLSRRREEQPHRAREPAPKDEHARLQGAARRRRAVA